MPEQTQPALVDGEFYERAVRIAENRPGPLADELRRALGYVTSTPEHVSP